MKHLDWIAWVVIAVLFVGFIALAINTWPTETTIYEFPVIEKELVEEVEAEEVKEEISPITQPAKPEVLAAQAPEPLMDSEGQAILADLNAYRLEKGKTVVGPDKQTCSLAEVRANHIATKGDFSHDGFYSMNLSYFYGYFVNASENLAKNYDYHEILDRWIESPTHNANLLAEVDNVCLKKAANYWVMELINY